MNNDTNWLQRNREEKLAGTNNKKLLPEFRSTVLLVCYTLSENRNAASFVRFESIQAHRKQRDAIFTALQLTSR